VGFLLQFIAFNTAQDLATKVLKDDHFGQLGFYSLGVHYACFGIFSFMSAPIVNKLGEKYSLMIGCSTYILYIGAFIPPCEWHEHPDDGLGSDFVLMYVMLMVFAGATGFGASILWVAQGKYLSNCSNE
jgi:MFS family permease